MTCACTNTPITVAQSGDGCCPENTTFADDQDCSATCGNGTIEGNETCDTAIASGPDACPTSCDDGMVCTTDTLVSAGTCQAACAHVMAADCPTAYRITQLTLQDPHPFANLMGCRDAKNFADGAQQDPMEHDRDNDGSFDDSQVIVFRPLSQTGGTTTAASLYFSANCTVNATSCKPGALTSPALVATSTTTGTCLAPLAGTTKPYNPAVTAATGPCFSTAAADMTTSVLGTQVTVKSLQIGGTFMGSPASGVINGVMAAFVTQAEAESRNIQISIISGSIASFFPGGSGNCAGSSDKDTLDGTAGWWVYYNFTATEVPWSDQ